MMLETIPKDWKTYLEEEFKKPYFEELIQWVDSAYNKDVCFPPKVSIFKAFALCNFKTLKVVIIGQDPYHNYGQAHGLCFSVPKGIKHPPSLTNIFKELEQDLQVPYPESGDLSSWASQGVLLLNATLTVQAHNPGSHQKKGWETFTDAVINIINTHKKGVVFLLWGGYAKKKATFIDNSKHYFLTSGHPSPLSANRGLWFGNKHFSKANALLKAEKSTPINW